MANAWDEYKKKHGISDQPAQQAETENAWERYKRETGIESGTNIWKKKVQNRAEASKRNREAQTQERRNLYAQKREIDNFTGPQPIGGEDAMKANYYHNLNQYGAKYGDAAAQDEGYRNYRQAMANVDKAFSAELEKNRRQDAAYDTFRQAAERVMPFKSDLSRAGRELTVQDQRYARDTNLYNQMGQAANQTGSKALWDKAEAGFNSSEYNRFKALANYEEADAQDTERLRTEDPAAFYAKTMSADEIAPALEESRTRRAALQAEYEKAYEAAQYDKSATWKMAQLQKQMEQADKDIAMYQSALSTRRAQETRQNLVTSAQNDRQFSSVANIGRSEYESYLSQERNRDVLRASEGFGDKLLRYLTEGGGVTDTTLSTGTMQASINAMRNGEGMSDHEAINSRLNELDDDMKELFYYWWNKDKEKALSFLEYGAEISRERQLKNIREWANDKPVLGTLAAAGVNLFSGADYLSALAEATATGSVGAHQPNVYLSDIRDTMHEGVTDNFNTAFGKFVYQVGTSMLDSAIGMSTGNTVPTFFLSAASSEYLEAKRRGASDEQALLSGTLSGLAECVFEEVSVEKLLSQNFDRGILLAVLQQAFTEASEEVTTTLANTISDIVLSNAYNFETKTAARRRELMASGMSYGEADSESKKEWLKEVLMDGLAGAASGGAMTGFHYVGAKIGEGVFKAADKVDTRNRNEKRGATIGAEEAQALRSFAEANGIKVSERVAQSTEENKTENAPTTEQEAKLSRREIRQERKANRDTGALQTAVVSKLTETVHERGLNSAQEIFNEQTEQHGAAITRIVQQAIVNEARTVFAQAQNQSELTKAYQQAVETATAKPVKQALKQAYQDATTLRAYQGDREAMTDALIGGGSGRALDLSAEIAEPDGSTQQVQIKALNTKQGEIVLDNGSTVTLDELQGLDADTKDVIQRLDAFELGEARPLAFLAYQTAVEKGDVTDGTRWVMSWALAFDQGRNGAISAQEAINRSSLPADVVRKAYELGAEQTETWRRQKEAENAKKREKAEDGATGRKGILDTSALTKEQYDSLSADKKDALSTLELISEATGVDIRLIAQKVTKRGNVKGYQGLYNKGGNYIEIDVNAGINNIFEDLHTGMTAVLGHELTHWMQESAPTEYLAYKKAVLQAIMSTKNGELTLDRMIEAQIKQNKRAGKEITRSQAEDEVVADASMKRMGDTEFWDAVSENLGDKKADVFAKIKEYISQFFNRVREIIGRASHTSEAAQIIDRVEADVQANLRRLYAEGIGAAMRSSAQTGTETKNAATEGGEELATRAFDSVKEIDEEINRLSEEYNRIFNDDRLAREKARKDPRVVKLQEAAWKAEDEKGRVGSLKERMAYRKMLDEVMEEMKITSVDDSLSEIRKQIDELKAEREAMVSVTPITGKQYKKLIDYFGTTQDYETAGFILQDGQMLDFSGKKQYGKNYSGGREIYHNEVGEVLNLETDTSPRINMINNGNIRLAPEVNGINLTQKPTAKQREALRGYIDHNDGNVQVDIDNTAGRTIETLHFYPGTSATRVLNDIDAYFDTGKTPAPQSDLRAFYSTRSDTAYLDAVERGDMETAQKMVDEAAKEAGYNIKAYHGTPKKFNVFSKDRIGSTTDYGWFGKGFYFTDKQDVASVYAGYLNDSNVIEAYLNVQNPFDFNEYPGAEDKTAGQIMEEVMGKKYGRRGELTEDDKAQRSEDFTNWLRENGYDGVRAWSQIMILDSEQAKRTDPVTYDDSGKVIPLSKRFNPEQEDIRYSVRPARELYRTEFDFSEPMTTDEFRKKIAQENDAAKYFPKGLSKAFLDTIKKKSLFNRTKLYRGIEAAEFDYLIKNGFLKSNSSYNFANQQGQTLADEDAGYALSYATGFAPREIADKHYKNGMPTYLIEFVNSPDLNVSKNNVQESYTYGEIDQKYIARIFEIEYDPDTKKDMIWDVTDSFKESLPQLGKGLEGLAHGAPQFYRDKTTGTILYAVQGADGYENGSYVSEKYPDVTFQYGQSGSLFNPEAMQKYFGISGNETDLEPMGVGKGGKLVPAGNESYSTRDYSDSSDLDLLLNAADEISEGGGEDYWASLLSEEPGLANETAEIKRLGKQLKKTAAELAEAQRNLTLTDRKLKTRGIATLAATIMQDQKAGDINKKDVKNRITAVLTDAYQKALDQLDAGADVGTAWETVYSEGVVKAADILLSDATYAEKHGYGWVKTSLGQYLGEGAREYVEADIGARVAEDFQANRYRPGQKGTIADRLVAQAENRVNRKLDAAKTENAALKAENAKLSEDKAFFEAQAKSAKETAGELYQQLLDKREELKNNTKISAEERKKTLKKLDNLQKQMQAKRKEAQAWKEKAQGEAKKVSQAIREKEAAVAKLEKQLQRERDILEGKLKPPAIQKMLAAAREREGKRIAEQKDERFAKYKEKQSAAQLRSRIKNLSDEMKRKMTKPTDGSYVPASLYGSMTQVADLLDNALAPKAGTKAEAKYRAMMDAIHALQSEYGKVAEMDDYTYKSEFDAEIMDEIKELEEVLTKDQSWVMAASNDNRSLREYSFGDLTRIYEILRTVNEAMTSASHFLGKANFQSIWDAMGQIAEQQGDMTSFNRLGWYGKKKRMRMLDSLNVMRAVEMMSGWDRNAALYRIMQQVESGVDVSNAWMMEYNKAMQALKTGKNEKAYRDALTKKLDFNVTDEEGLPVLMTKMQALQLLMTAEREAHNDKLVHLQRGGATIRDALAIQDGKKDAAAQNIKVTPDLISRIQQSLTEWDKAYMKAVRNYFGREGKATNRVLYNLKHRVLQTEDYYVPYNVDKNYLDTNLDETQAMNMWVKTPGSTNALQKKASQPVIIDGMDTVMAKHVREIADYIGLAIPIRDFAKVYNGRLKQGEGENPLPVKQTIDKNWKAKGQHLLTQSIIDVQGGSRGASWSTAIAEKLNALQSAFVKSALLVNPSVTIKQAASYAAAGSILSHAALDRANHPISVKTDESNAFDPATGLIGHIFFAPNGATAMRIYNEIDKHTSLHYMRRQGMSQVELANEANRSGKLKRALNSVGASMEQTAAGHIARKVGASLNPVSWIQRMDVATTATLWLACKEQARMDGMKVGTDEYWQHVTELYERVIRETQPMYDSLHRNAMQKQHEGLMQYLFPFRTVPIQNHGQLAAAYETMQASKNKSEADQKTATKFFAKTLWAQTESAFVFSLMTFLAAALKRKTKKYRDEDEELTLSSVGLGFGKDMASTALSVLFPMMGSEIGSVLSRISDKIDGSSGYTYDAFSVGVVDLLNDLSTSFDKVFADIGKFSRGENISAEDILSDCGKALLKLSKLKGFPGDTIKTYAEGMIGNVNDVLEGRFPALNDASWERSAATNARRFIKALEAGDEAKAEAVMEEMRQNILKDKPNLKADKVNAKIRSAVQSYVKQQYLDDEMSEDKAIHYMVEYGSADDENDAFWKIREWEAREAWDGEADDFSFSKYTKLREIIDNVGDISEEMQYLQDHGVKFEDANKEIKSYIGKQLKAGEYDEDEAMKTLQAYHKVKDEKTKQYRPDTDDEAWFAVQEWMAQAEHADEDDYSWNKYEDLFAAMDTGGDIEPHADELESHGVKTNTIKDAVVAHVKERYEAGEVNASEAMRLLQKYSGMDANESYWKVDEWDAKEAAYNSGEEFSSTNYRDLYAAMDANKDAATAIKELADHGYKKSQITEATKTYLKSQLEEGKINETQFRNKIAHYLGITKTEDGDVLVKEVSNAKRYKEMQKQYPNLDFTSDEATRYCDGTTKSQESGRKSAKAAGMSLEAYLKARAVLKDVKGYDNNGDGKADNCSREKMFIQALDGMNLTAAQKWALYYEEYEGKNWNKIARPSW